MCVKKTKSFIFSVLFRNTFTIMLEDVKRKKKTSLTITIYLKKQINPVAIRGADVNVVNSKSYIFSLLFSCITFFPYCKSKSPSTRDSV